MHRHTVRDMGSAAASLQHEFCPRTLHLHAVLADIRLVRSLATIIMEKNASFDIQHGPYSAVNGEAVQFETITSTDVMELSGVQRHHCLLASRYFDVLTKMGDTPTLLMDAFPEPPVGRSDHHVEISSGGHILETELCRDPFAKVLRYHVKSLHVHDACIRESMSQGGWFSLRWCRVERCPNFEDSLFHLDAQDFRELEVVWVSELATARCLWSKEHVSWTSRWLQFNSLRHLYLRSCTRLVYALPLRVHYALGKLETIHVVRCGNIRHVFELGEQDDSKDIASIGIELRALTTIHLYDLPMLRGIFEVKRTFAPRLQSVRIRGCFGLRWLPAPVEKESPGVRWPRPSVEVEKDVWDALEWDGAGVGHHPSYYEPPVHSRHCRRSRLLRRTVLRYLIFGSYQFALLPSIFMHALHISV